LDKRRFNSGFILFSNNIFDSLDLSLNLFFVSLDFFFILVEFFISFQLDVCFLGFLESIFGVFDGLFLFGEDALLIHQALLFIDDSFGVYGVGTGATFGFLVFDLVFILPLFEGFLVDNNLSFELL
jgi:hypothetical protein